MTHGGAAGFREEIPNNWPSEIVSLIEDGWHQVRLQRQLVPQHAAIMSPQLCGSRVLKCNVVVACRTVSFAP